ncbi:MAG: 16S rRNA (cytosine(967)-C(5))-methyltransferase RsmB [Clostridia bacterium]|nr:16S rRNA (cytosine(967)-C(5))-methyltransferase RsmB [Clostridia bacterium]
MAENNVNVRKAAHRSLMAIMKNGRYSNLEIDSVLRNSADMAEADRALYTRLVYGVIERRLTLDHIVSQYTSRKLCDIDSASLTSLRLGLYQLIYTDRIPDFAAVSETVDTAPQKAKGFVNGILRSFLRGGKSFSLPEGNSPEALSLRYSVSEDVTRVLLDSYGADETEKILEASFTPEKVCLRINTLKISPDEAANLLPESERGNYSDDILRVSSVDKAVRDGIDAGLWFVQDEASRIAVRTLGATPCDIIADTCAAPGGKTLSAAIDGKGECKLFSFDLHENKLSLIRSAAEKLGIPNVSTEKRDAREPKGELIGKCDRVLCDAPCSGLGVLGKKPDIRYKDGDSVGKLPEIQYGVLCGAAKYVKDGGVLLYSTCTLNKKENEEVVSRFLKENTNFSPVDFSFGSSRGLPTLESRNGMLTLFPHISHTDGFFVAKMKKSK